MSLGCFCKFKQKNKIKINRNVQEEEVNDGALEGNQGLCHYFQLTLFLNSLNGRART